MVGGLFENEYRLGPNNDWSILVANTMPLREKALKLVRDVYLGKGYALRVNQDSELWCTIHHLHPYTVTFLAIKAGQAAGTVSIVPDSLLGLPADAIFPERLAFLRKAGRRLSEIFSLSVDEGVDHSSIDLTMHLYRFVHLTATRLFHNTDIVASVMAHHADFYSKILLFDEVFPDPCQSPKTGEQVIFARLNLETMERRYSEKYGHLKGKRNLHRWFFQNEDAEHMADWIRRNRRPVTADEVDYLGTRKSQALFDAGSDSVAVLMEYCKNAGSERKGLIRGS